MNSQARERLRADAANLEALGVPEYAADLRALLSYVEVLEREREALRYLDEIGGKWTSMTGSEPSEVIVRTQRNLDQALRDWSAARAATDALREK